MSHFVCPRGTNISYIQERGRDTHFSHTVGDKLFHTQRGGQTFLHHFLLEAVAAMMMLINLSKANIFVSEASKLSAGARIFRGP